MANGNKGKGGKRAPAKKYPATDAGKQERFRDFANKRVNRALSSIRAVGKLASPRSYKYSEAEVTKIREALVAEVADAMKQFSTAGVETSAGFDITKG